MGYLSLEDQEQLVAQAEAGDTESIIDTFLGFLEHLDKLFEARTGLDRVLMRSKVQHMLNDLLACKTGQLPERLPVVNEDGLEVEVAGS